MQFNWGTGLTIFFIIFVAALGFVLYQAKQQDNSLVMDNYYEEDLKYQQQFDKIKNTSELPEKVIIEYNKAGKMLVLSFPGDSTASISGSVILYNPAYQKSDVKYDFNIGKRSKYNISLDKISLGRWKIKIDWQQSDKKYYQEEEIIL
ncbi:MAG: FixH family protein [Saprospiraceae bacterium]|nr:FixH family protein [Saprospiraceae bacterium]